MTRPMIDSRRFAMPPPDATGAARGASRRAWLRNAGAVAAACGVGALPGLVAPARGQGGNALEKEIVFAGFGGSIQQIMEKFLLPGFTKETGVRVVYVAGSADKLFAQVQASAARPTVDVLWSNPSTHLRGKVSGLLDRIDPQKVPNLARVFPRFRDPDGVGVAMGVNPFGLSYNRKILAERSIPAPTSWDDLWDARYKGHVALYNIDLAFTSFWLPVLAKSMGTTTAQMDPVFKRLAALKPNLVAIPTNTAEMQTLFQQGAVWIAVNTNARTYQMRDDGMDVEWVAPKQGAVEFMNYYDVVKGAPNPNAAQALVNHLMSPESQQLLAEKLYFGPVLQGLQLSEKLRRETYYSPEALNNLVPVDVADLTQRLPGWSRRWAAEVAR